MRAIVVYLENKRNLMIEFGCLYTSWKYIKSHDTDLVVFGTKDALEQIPDDCIKVVSEPISYLPEWNDYHFINSINCLTIPEASFLDTYETILRTDVDTFLTPRWNSFYPKKYTVGIGMYVKDEYTRNRILNISKKLQLNHRGVHNIGSSHYGEPVLVRNVCKLSMKITSYILNNEFIGEPNNGYNWLRNGRAWHKGVSSMYGMEIASNYLIEDINIGKLDCQSTTNDNVNLIPHIHCYHTSDIFSKFEFESGKYNYLTIQNLDINKVKDYCLYIALISKLHK